MAEDWLAEVLQVARTLDTATLERLGEALAKVEVPTPEWTRRLAAEAGTAAARAQVHTLLEAWRTRAVAVTGAALALVLRAAVLTEKAVRSESRAELVWTGPLPRGGTERRTDQALREVIRAARERLLIVSFAAYRVPDIHVALLEAVSRGVALQFLFESETESGGRVRGEPAKSLPPELARAATVYHWAAARRGRRQDTAGKEVMGVLHAKCALADEEVLLVSSANLTPDALELNMEMGVLVRGGVLPRQVRVHFERLQEEGILKAVVGSVRDS